MKNIFFILIFTLSFLYSPTICSSQENEKTQDELSDTNNDIFVVGGENSEEKTSKEINAVDLGESFAPHKYASLSEAEEETKPLGVPYKIESGEELPEEVFIVGGEKSKTKTAEEIEQIGLGETYEESRYENYEESQEKAKTRPLGTPYTVDPGEELHDGVLVVGGDDSEEKTSREIGNIEFGEPFVNYQYESFEDSSQESDSRPLGTPYSIEPGEEMHKGVYIVGGEGSDEENIENSNDVPLGLPYQSKKYLSEEDAQRDASSRDLAVPYSIRSEAQREARE